VRKEEMRKLTVCSLELYLIAPFIQSEPGFLPPAVSLHARLLIFLVSPLRAFLTSRVLACQAITKKVIP
jgi:hypothetical protein